MTDTERLRLIAGRTSDDPDQAFLYAIADRIDWRKEPPDKPGWWLAWYEASGSNGGRGHFCAEFIGDEFFVAGQDHRPLRSKHWLGPLPEPKERAQ